MTRYSWRRGKDYDGLRRLPESYELRYGGKLLAYAQEIKGGWFWYGDGVNTAHRPDTLENVKAEAVEYFRQRVATTKQPT